jgi:integrase
MAKTIRDSSLETRTARTRLPAGPKPHYRALDPGLHIGYRKGKTGGKWVMRWYVGDQDYKVQTIGTADDNADADGVAVLNFRQAQTKAREAFARMAADTAGIRRGPYTVRDCLDDYFKATDRLSNAKNRVVAEALILPRLGALEVAALVPDTLRVWLTDLAADPAKVRDPAKPLPKRPPVSDDAEAVRKRKASANRVRIMLVAALNSAFHDGKVSSDLAWRRVKPFNRVDAARSRYLTIEEAKRLIQGCATDDFRHLVQAALLTGARYSELARLDVRDFNPDAGTVFIRLSKSGKGRHVVLTEEGLAVFAHLAAGRAPEAALLPRRGYERWTPAHQTVPMALAVARAGIDPPISLHGLRHTYASHAVMNGAPLLVVAKNLGHANTKMVERHYGHLSESYVSDTIRATAPRFGIMATPHQPEPRAAP